MHNRINNAFVFNLKIKLFAALTRQCLLRCFARLDFAAHELPKSALRLVRRTLANKVTITVFDDRTYNFDNFRAIHFIQPIVHDAWLTVLATTRI